MLLILWGAIKTGETNNNQIEIFFISHNISYPTTLFLFCVFESMDSGYKFDPLIYNV